MSISTEMDRIKNAKLTLAAKLTAMGLDGEGLVDELINEVDGITVHNYSGYADNDVTTEDLGTESATYNLDAGYYKNSFLLSHPDNGETGGGGHTIDILCYSNWHYLDMQDGDLGNRCVYGYYAINRSITGSDDNEIEIDYATVNFNEQHYCVCRIPHVPEGAFVEIAVPYNSFFYILENANGCTAKEQLSTLIENTSYGSDGEHRVYRLTNITDGATLEFGYSE